MRISVGLGAAALLSVTAAPALSQAWIGAMVGNMIAQQQAAAKEHACMMGTAMPPSEVDETRGYTAASIAAYAAAAGKGGPADVRSAWQRDDGKARWTDGKTELGYDRLGAVTDRFLGGGAGVDATPQAYLRSGDGRLVEGLWGARNSAGSVIGIYDATFTRVSGVWRLRSLTLFDPSAAPATLVQYCHKPGDVEPYKIAWEARQRKIEAKRAAKAAAKAAREAERAAKATTAGR